MDLIGGINNLAGDLIGCLTSEVNAESQEYQKNRTNLCVFASLREADC